ncbi:MAG: hypothetical protein ACI85Q_002116 [Salibacteraceae bacterium]
MANSPEEYAQFSLDLIQDSLASKQLAIASYNWVKKNYDWSKNGQKLLDLLDK